MANSSTKIQGKGVRIATVYTREAFDDFRPTTMNFTRWLRISESLAGLGYQVDMVMNGSGRTACPKANLRAIPYAQVNWRDYDVVKTLFHKGFKSLVEEGGGDHPFIISKLGSVAGSCDTPGVHFFNDERQRLYDLQLQMARASRYITVLTEDSRRLWEREHGGGNILLVPTGVDSIIPAPGENPYRAFPEKIVCYVGNLNQEEQRDINLLWQERLNALGRRLKRRGMRLCVISRGLTDRIDPEAVTCMGTVENDRVWDYHYFAAVGISLAQGRVQHNESSKIYYYLRAGLPVVSEAPIPNNGLIEEANLGLIADYGNDEMMAGMIEDAVARPWNRARAMEYVVANHTWDKRALIYRELIDRIK
jgi:hypothetical protein